ncbi:ABC transporter substrate-binding protein [Adhaeribacter aquaticus]|uniref:ABC transporter substrate-binding protein n=1 Tax=Adhaeribacter aquaticus TaxID=299567 RepID=UPI0004112958|nr:helical backbone metal receptor [Adhaeribacter aquaticus]
MFVKKLFYFFSIFLASLFYACQSKQPQEKQINSVTVTDDLGRKVKIPANPKRIMALAPSATEMLYAVADEKTIIGRTQNCDFPEKVKKKPVVNNYPMDYEQLVLLKPDLIFTVEGITPAEVAAKLERDLHIPVYYQKYEKVQDIFKGLTNIGKILGREERAKQVVDSLKNELAQIQPVKTSNAKPQVLAITWNDPIYVYGQNTLFTDKLRFLGAENAVKEVFAQSYPALTREYILKLNPDIIIGAEPEKMETTFFKQYPELKKVKAYQQKKIFKATDDLMARPSPRVVASIKELKNFIK